MHRHMRVYKKHSYIQIESEEDRERRINST